MAYSYNNYTASGSQANFTFPFPYLDAANIYATVNATPAYYVWVSPNTIQIIPTPAAGLAVQVYRSTTTGAQPASWTNGSVLKDSDLNRLALFCLYTAQEQMDRGSGGAVGSGVLTIPEIVSGLYGQITLDSFATSLASTIGLIAADATVAGSVANLVSIETTARSNADSAFQTTINTMQSVVTGALATVNAEATTRAAADSALATSVNTVQSSVTGMTNRVASVETSAAASVTQLGVVNANSTIKVEATAGGKKAIVGLGLNATTDGTTTQSEMIFLADKFQFISTLSGTSETPQGLLQLGVSNGVSSLVLASTKYGDQSIGANFIVDGAITSRKLTVTGLPSFSVWADTGFQDPSAWTLANGAWGVFPTQGLVTDGVAGGTTLRSPVASNANAFGTQRVAVTVGRKYRLSCRMRTVGGANGILYLRLSAWNTKASSYGPSEIIVGVEGVPGTTSWQLFSGIFTATLPFASPMVLVNHSQSSGSGYMEAQDIRIEEMLDSSLMVTGGITTDSLNTNGLVVRDLSGNPIFGVGTNLDNSRITAAPGWLNSNVLVGGRNLAPLSTVFSAATMNVNAGSFNAGMQADPTGGLTGQVVTLTATAGGWDLFRQPSGLINGQVYTASVWVKLGTATNFCFAVNNTQAWNTGGGVVLTGAGWQRAVVQIVPTVGAVNIHFGSHAQAMPQQTAGTVTLAFFQFEQGNTATQWMPAPEDVTAGIAGAATTANWATVSGSGKPADNATANQSDATTNGAINTAQTTANNAAAAAADRISKSAASILSATVSINAAAGAGFVAGTMTWNSAGARTGGYGVALTPGGITAYSPAGVNTFYLDAVTGNAYFGGTLKVGAATKGASVLTSQAFTNIPGAATGISISPINTVTYTATGNDVIVLFNITVALQTNTNTGARIVLTPYMDSTAIPSAIGGYAPEFEVPMTNSPQDWFANGSGATGYGWCTTQSFNFSLILPGTFVTSGAHTFKLGISATFTSSGGSLALNTVTGSSLFAEATSSLREFLA